MKYRHRGDAASDAIARWEAIEGNERSLTDRQRRQLRLQIREAMVRWEGQHAPRPKIDRCKLCRHRQAVAGHDGMCVGCWTDRAIG